jgi:hypothetical protein
MLAQPKAQRKATNSSVLHHSKFETSMSALGQKRTFTKKPEPRHPWFELAS